MSLKLSKVSVAVFSVLLAGAATAADMQEQGGDKSNHADGVINAGGFEIKPTLSLAIGKNDNVGLASAAQTSSNFTRLSPTISIAMPTHGQLYSATYSGIYANYTGSTIDNFNDHNFGLAAKNDWSTRINSLVNVDYNKGHDGRNEIKNTGIPSAFVELWHTTGVKGMAHYGADGAQGQFELTAGQIAKRYDSNNRGGTQLLDNDATNLTGAFFYKVAPATQMIFQAGTTKIAYRVAPALAINNRDSTENQYMVGVKWDATAKTTGSIKVGQVNKTFNLGLQPSSTSTAWDANVTWSPLTYSNVNLTLAQKAVESGGTGSFMISRDSNLNWTHEWSSQIKSALSVGDGLDTYKNSTQVNKRQTYGAKLSYSVNRWLNAGVEYQNSKRDSTLAALTNTQAITMLVLDGTL
ncbi:MAG: outer membrane beta-barrel protein [Gallionella sp.]|nr:outer membrane beta-barrel protein [Gallionella sp.]